MKNDETPVPKPELYYNLGAGAVTNTPSQLYSAFGGSGQSALALTEEDAVSAATRLLTGGTGYERIYVLGVVAVVERTSSPVKVTKFE